MRTRVFISPLTGRAYSTRDYALMEGGGLIARTKHDVTADVVETLMAEAWARGWNECNAAAEGDAPPNPYRPTPDAPPHPASRESEQAAAGAGVVSAAMSAAHRPFNRADMDTPAGEIRRVILYEIASRCGQVPDLHPRLLEGIESAARRLAERAGEAQNG